MTSTQYRLFEKIIKTNSFVEINKNPNILQTLLEMGVHIHYLHRIKKYIIEGRYRYSHELYKNYRGGNNLNLIKNYYLTKVLKIKRVSMHSFYIDFPEEFDSFYDWIKYELIVQYD